MASSEAARRDSDTSADLGGKPGRVRAWSPNRGYAVFLIPPALLLAAFFVLPLVLLVLRALSDPTLGLGNYSRLFTNSSYVGVLFYTVQVAGSVTLVALFLSYPVAWLLSWARGRMLHLALAFVIIPFWTSAVIRTYAWIVLFQRRGVVNDALMSLGFIDAPLRLMYNSLGVHIGMVHIMLPF